ncbi:tail protein [Agrobacterium phage Atu_ph02]|uniref:Tail fibers protein n=1 Tax=Agrobacterium phage Atu_ph02 TaxID=2024261 RepID=A0A223W0M1_9CAUD|nr:tail protein [Agrobacterium phage Atu_ph02]ASV44568.1 tail fibers protein [Agrobacterium phage Atu_ph02]
METKLSLVNHLLQVVGERRVTTLETGHPSVIQAIQALESMNRDFQGKGWWFNTNRDVRLVPNNLGEVLLPSEALAFSITRHQLDYMQPANKQQYVKRGKRLYDAWNNTYTINRTLMADLVIEIEIEDLPQIAATYLKHWSAETYYVDDDGDIQKSDRLAQRTMLAFHALKAEQMRVMSINALDSPAAQNLRYRIGNTGLAHRAQFLGGRIT